MQTRNNARDPDLYYLHAMSQLIIDIDDVLIADPLPRLWQLLAMETGMTQSAIEQLWRQELAEAFFTEQVPTEALWQWLEQRFGIRDREMWVEYCQAHCYPLLSLQMLGPFSAYTTITLISNGRHDWFDPILISEGALPFCHQVLLSADLGKLKPDPTALTVIESLPGPRLFVDDDPASRAIAQSLGCDVLHADRLLSWVAEATTWLHRH
jgi:FMN phosphatase YigB (HAD superfamily)